MRDPAEAAHSGPLTLEVIARVASQYDCEFTSNSVALPLSRHRDKRHAGRLTFRRWRDGNDDQRSVALAGSVGAGRAKTVLMLSL
jgi:hypothetical protein